MKSPYQFIHLAPKVQGEKQPAIFLLHGLGSDEKDLLQLVEGFQQNSHIFSLQGPVKHSPGYAFYTFEEEGKPERHIFDKVVQFTQNFIVEAIQEYDIALDQIYLVGFNQGAAIAQAVAVTLGNMVRGTVALSGFLPEFVELEYKKAEMNHSSIFISHGEYDYVYPMAWGQNSARFFEEFGANVTFYQFADGHGVTTDVLQAFTAFLNALMPPTVQN